MVEHLRMQKEVAVWLFHVRVHIGDAMSVPRQKPCQAGRHEGLAGTALSTGYCDFHR
jgi:hypothetical protein